VGIIPQSDQESPGAARPARSSPDRAQAGQAQTPAAAAQPAATFVGQDTCLGCHDEVDYSIATSKHGRATDPRTPSAREGCESCHGPGSRHLEDPSANPLKSFSKLPAAEVNDTCATCHNRGEHALWSGSAHEQRDLSCATCHSVHKPKSQVAQLKAPDQFALCATCHRDKVAKLDRSGHMPLREGKMQCTTCHNTHGSPASKMLRKDSAAELCTSCHADKRGPYLWEHAPTRDGCVTCHDPHGSSNERMLVTRPPILCQRCHVATRHPSTIYDAGLIGTSARVYARSCVTCHAAIHGSNHPSGQRFIR
jgi:DmsE family decaheme c-type cytochrome